MRNMKTYELLYELLYGGQRGLYANHAPIDIDDIRFELSRRSEGSCGQNIDEWIEWFINSSTEGTDEEKVSIKNIWKIYQIEKKAMAKLGLNFRHLTFEEDSTQE